MNIYNFNDNSFKETTIYKDFINKNPSFSVLKIRTTAASDAIPISGVRIIVSKEIENNKVIFYDGITDNSGMINNIILPTPDTNIDDLVAPSGTLYDIEAIYNNIDKNYSILMYAGIYVIQNINIVPVSGDNYGS